MVMHFHHWKTLGVPCYAMSDRSTLDPVFYIVNRRLKKSACAWVSGLTEATLKGFLPGKN